MFSPFVALVCLEELLPKERRKRKRRKDAPFVDKMDALWWVASLPWTFDTCFALGMAFLVLVAFGD